MNRLAHTIFLATAASGAILGAVLWTQWGAAIWIAGVVGWCG